MAIKCDCGNALIEKDICVVDMAGPDYYPYEGNIYFFVCPDCGYMTEKTETEMDKSGGF